MSTTSSTRRERNLSLEVLPVRDQLATWDAYVNDPRSGVPVGIPEIDSKLDGGGLSPGELVIFGGRPSTRKTTVMFNMAWAMMREGHATGLIGLDEPDFRYVGKMMSAMSGEPVARIRDEWDTPWGKALQDRYHDEADGLIALGQGSEPTIKELDQFLLDAETMYHCAPEVVFFDYLSLMYSDRYDGRDQNRIPRLVRALQTWTHDRGVCLVVLHHVARYDEGLGAKNHGEKPMSPEGLMYGGEAFADIVFATYRPSLDPLGEHDFETVKISHPKMKFEEWQQRRKRVEHFREHTFLQLLKNRPGVETMPRGTLLRSVGQSMKMEPDPDFEQPWRVESENDDQALDRMRAFGEEEEDG